MSFLRVAANHVLEARVPPFLVHPAVFRGSGFSVSMSRQLAGFRWHAALSKQGQDTRDAIPHCRPRHR